MKNLLVFVPALTFVALAVSFAEDCEVACDSVQCIGRTDNGSCNQYENPCIVIINTNDPEGDDVNGTVDNRRRVVTCTQICDPVFMPPGITIIGLASDCTSNNAWKDTSYCGEECIEDDDCGTGDVICAPVL